MTDGGILAGRSVAASTHPMRMVPSASRLPSLRRRASCAITRAARPALVDGFQTLPGVFSADGVDRGSALLAAALFRRKDAPFGIAGGGEVGQAIQLAAMDPQAKLLLMPFRRLAIVDLV